MQKLTITHVRNWQVHRRKVGEGHVYQGRYKSFPIETDDHFYQVMRYVRANPVRAKLASSPDRWQWGSLWRRVHGGREARAWLSKWPLPQPRGWLDIVASRQPKSQVEQIRQSVRRGQPYGSAKWMQTTAAALNLESTLRPRGRPAKQSDHPSQYRNTKQLDPFRFTFPQSNSRLGRRKWVRTAMPSNSVRMWAE